MSNLIKALKASFDGKQEIENNDFLRHDNDFVTTRDDNKSSQCVSQNEGGNKT